MRKYLRALFLVIFSQCFHINANAQIDVPKWVADIGGPSSNCISSGVGVDKQNNIYIGGFFSGTADFDPSAAGTHNLTAKGNYDGFVAKYTTDGKLIWAVSMGGSSTTQVNSMCVDANGDPIITGQFDSSDLDADPGPGTAILSAQGGYDAFVIKLDADGGFVWAKSIGGSGTDYGVHVIADSQGNVIENIRYQSAVQVGSQIYTAQSSQFNGLAVKYDPNGNLIWAINIGDTGDSEVDYSTVDHLGNVLLCGPFQGNDNFNPLGAASYLNANGGATFIAKYTSAGSLIWVKSFNGPPANICVNSKNDIFLDGPFSSTISFNGTSLNPVGAQDLYLAKYSSAGGFEFAKDVGGANGSMFNYGIQSSQDDYIFISGYFNGTIDFDPSPATSAFISDHGQRDFFLTKYDSDLNYKWAFNGGSPNCSNSLGRAITVDNNNDILFTGGFCSTVNFSASTCAPYPLTAQSSSRDCFLGKYVQNAATPAAQITGFTVPQQSAPAVIDQTNLKITVTVPYGTDITALKPSIVYSSGVTISPASGVAEDFTSGVTYTLASSCASLNYAVNVIVAAATPNPPVCATSGVDGTTNINGSIDTYFPPQGDVTLPAGSSSISLSGVPATDAYGNSFGATPIKSGDLLIIIQMQDATIDFDNSTLYGSGSATAGADGLGGTGFTNIGSSGKFEYVIATNNVPLTGGTLTFKGSGASNGTVYDYVSAAPTATRGKRTFQIIRLPQYSNLKLSSNISPPPFNGNAGGIIAFDVAGNMDFNGYTIDVSGRGFRGGYSLIKVTQLVNLNDLYVAPADDNRVSGKGEGIAGTPKYMWDGYNQVDNIVEGLPNGSGGRGAPANAAGGGNDVNAGGGGGGNGGGGGVGGDGYGGDPGTYPNGGRPGAVSYNGSVDPTRLIMGGGGGGGHANDALTGVKGGVGGGIVLITAASVSGNGTILANGGNGAPGTYGGHPDGSGGGGAGGTVFVMLSSPVASSALTIQAKGGLGGNTEFDNPVTDGVQPHGPGGGGGGGEVVYAISSGTVNIDVAGGKSGKTDSGNGITHNAGDGLPGVADKILVASLPPYLQNSGGSCYPILVTTMSVAKAYQAKASGDTVHYHIKIVNATTGGNAGAVEADCSFPSGFLFSSATVKYAGTANGPSLLNNLGTATAPVLGDFNIPSGDSVMIDMVVNIACVTNGEYNGSAQATYADPSRTTADPNRRITAATNAFAGSNTTYETTIAGPVPGSNYDGSASTAEDVVITNLPITNNAITAPSVTAYCLGGAPTSITGSAPTGGSGTYGYQWQLSTDNVNFNDISGATAQNYTPAGIGVTTYYRRTVTSGSCITPLNSNVVAITIQSPPANNAITAPVTGTLCSGGQPAAIAGSIPTGGDGTTYAYQWQVSDDNTTFTDITGATAKDYTPPLLYATTYYRRTVTSGSCTTPVNSNVITITVQAPLNNNSITPPAVVTFCSNGTPSTITGDVPTGGNGVYAYTWQSSTDDIIYTDIPGATGQNYNPGPISVTTYYHRTITSGSCTTPLISNSLVLTITPAPPTPVPSSSSVNVCTGNTATLSLTNPVSGITYNWYDSPAKTNLVFTGTTYTTGAINNNITYYIEAINGSCSSPATASVSVNVIALPQAPVIVNGSTQQTCTGTQTTLSIASPQQNITYNWYADATTTNITYTGTNFLTPTINSTQTYYVEALNSSSCGSTTRTAVTVTALPAPAAPTISGTGTAICPGTSATLTASSSDPNATINWYAGATTATSLATGNSFTTPVLSANTTYYADAVNTNSCFSPTRTPVIVQMLQPLAAPVVSVASTTATSVTFQWTAVTGATGYEESIDNGQTFTAPSSGSDALTQTISNLTTGQTVTIIVQAAGGSACELSASSTAITGTATDPNADQIYVANAFTPNGDGKNDIVYVHSNTIKSMNFYVYDQWGEMLYRSSNIANGWDGTYKGAKEPVGVYVYYVQAIMIDGKQVNKKGTITLLR